MPSSRLSWATASKVASRHAHAELADGLDGARLLVADRQAQLAAVGGRSARRSGSSCAPGCLGRPAPHAGALAGARHDGQRVLARQLVAQRGELGADLRSSPRGRRSRMARSPSASSAAAFCLAASSLATASTSACAWRSCLGSVSVISIARALLAPAAPGARPARSSRRPPRPARRKRDAAGACRSASRLTQSVSSGASSPPAAACRRSGCPSSALTPSASTWSGTSMPWSLVDLAQARDQLALAPLLVELAAHQVLAMAQRVHHVHRDHDVVERLRLARRKRGLGHGLIRPIADQAAAGQRRRRPRSAGPCASCPPPPRRGSRPSSASRACASRR